MPLDIGESRELLIVTRGIQIGLQVELPGCIARIAESALQYRLAIAGGPRSDIICLIQHCDPTTASRQAVGGAAPGHASPDDEHMTRGTRVRRQLQPTGRVRLRRGLA